MANGSQILSFKAFVISILLLSIFLVSKPSVPAIRELLTSMVPQEWNALLSLSKPPFLFLLINAIIISIVASSRFHHKAQDPREIRLNPVVLDVDAYGQMEVKVPDPSMLSKDPLEIQQDPAVLVAEADGDTEEEADFSDCRSDWARDPSEKPMVAVRFGSRKGVKASSQESKALEVTGPKCNETLESVWKRIMESRSIPIPQHLKKSDTSDRSGHPQSDVTKIQRSSHSPFLISQKPNKPLPREPSPSQDELNRQAEAFIKKFNEQLKHQRQDIEGE